MTPAEIEQKIRLISERIRVIDADTPEMTGMDWASDHGWIAQDEWESAGERAQAGVKLQDAEVEKIEALRKEHPRAVDEFLGTHIERLKKTRGELDRLSRAADERGLEFALRFNLTLLPDIIVCLEAWRGKKKVKHWPAWMWRVAFRVCEESETFIARETGSGSG